MGPAVARHSLAYGSQAEARETFPSSANSTDCAQWRTKFRTPFHKPFLINASSSRLALSLPHVDRGPYIDRRRGPPERMRLNPRTFRSFRCSLACFAGLLFTLSRFTPSRPFRDHRCKTVGSRGKTVLARSPSLILKRTQLQNAEREWHI